MTETMPDPVEGPQAGAGEPVDPAGRVPGPPWERAGVEVVGVNFPDRTVEVIVIPYDRETDVPHPLKRNGGIVTEVINRGAFDGIEHRPTRVKANRDHDRTRTFGRAISFHPAHQKGLHAEIRVARTDLGTETLNLADDGCLDASAGFFPMRDGMHWNSPTSYRITRAFLHHIALVPDGQYGEDAGVLAVRAAVPAPVEGDQRPMPVLARVDLDMWQARLAEIDARWLR